MAHPNVPQRSLYLTAALLPLLWLLPSSALNNGLGRTPPMGYSSWYSVDSEVTEAHMHSMCSLLVSTGMAAAGYKYCNVSRLCSRNRFPQ